MFPEAKPRERLRSKGNKTLSFPRGQSQSVFVIPPNSQVEKTMRKNRLLYAGWLTNLEQEPDHMRVESSCCLPRGLVSFIRPWEIVSFDSRHVTRFAPIGNHI